MVDCDYLAGWNSAVGLVPGIHDRVCVSACPESYLAVAAVTGRNYSDHSVSHEIEGCCGVGSEDDY